MDPVEELKRLHETPKERLERIRYGTPTSPDWASIESGDQTWLLRVCEAAIEHLEAGDLDAEEFLRFRALLGDPESQEVLAMEGHG